MTARDTDPSVHPLETSEFYELMQAYRHASPLDQKEVCGRFDAVRDWLRLRTSQEWVDVADEMPPTDRVLIIADATGFGRMGYWDGLIWRNENCGSLNLDGFTPASWRRYIPPPKGEAP